MELGGTVLAHYQLNNIWLNPLDSMFMGILWTLYYQDLLPMLRTPRSWFTAGVLSIIVVLFWISGSTWYHTGFYTAVTVYPYLMMLSVLHLREYLVHPAISGILNEFSFRVSILNFGFFGIMALNKGIRIFEDPVQNPEGIYMNLNIFIAISFVYLSLISWWAMQFARQKGHQG